jgi:hypothetical protein
MITRPLAGVLIVLSSLAAAQTPAPPSPSHSAKAAPHQTSDSQLYRNTTFGFRYKIPYGWVDRSKEMQEQAATASSDPPGNSAADPSPENIPIPKAAPTPTKEKKAPQADVLLAIFERPPAARGDNVNSAVVIASEPVSSYPGLKKAEEYLGPLSELAEAKGFKSDGDPDVIEVDSRQLIRADFVKPLGITKNNEKLAMHQSTLILLAKGQIVSFTFIAGSEDGVEDLMEGLHFAAAKPAAR